MLELQYVFLEGKGRDELAKICSRYKGEGVEK